MLPRRRSNHPGSSFPLPFLLVCGLLLAAAVAFSPAAAAEAAGGGGGGGGAGHEGRAGKPEVEAEDGVAVAEAGGEVVAQGNATEAKEGSLADMIDRALEKEFPESEGEQGGGGAWIWPTPGIHRSVRARDLVLGRVCGWARWRVSVAVLFRSRHRWLERVGTLRMEVPVWAWSCLC